MNNLNTVVSFTKPRLCTECECCSKREECLLGRLFPEAGPRGNGMCKPLQVIHLAAGEDLFRRQEECRSLFVICSGAIKTQRVTPEGDLVVTGLWLPGDILGLEALGGAEYEFDAVATRAGTVVRVEVGMLLEACRQRPEANIWFAQRLSHLLRRRDIDQVSSKGLQSNARILRFFLDLHERTRQGNTDLAIEGELPMHKQDIARYLNMTPETLSRNLSTLRRKRSLFISKTHYTVPDVAYVRTITSL